MLSLNYGILSVNFVISKNMVQLKELFPDVPYIDLFQGRIDKAGIETPEQLINDFQTKGEHKVPIEIISRGTADCLNYYKAFGMAYLTNLICKTYPDA